MGIGDKVNAFGRGMKSLGKKAWTGTKMGLKGLGYLMGGAVALGVPALAVQGAMLNKAIDTRGRTMNPLDN